VFQKPLPRADQPRKPAPRSLIQKLLRVPPVIAISKSPLWRILLIRCLEGVVASVSTPLLFVRVPSNRDRTPDNGEALTLTAITGAGDGGTAGTASIDDVTFHGFIA
jgi:hypothetical protein